MAIEHTVYAVDVQFDFPEEWGNPLTIVNSVEILTLHYVVWERFSKWINLANQNQAPNSNSLAHMKDLCNGFDTHSIRVAVQIDGDMELLQHTIKAMKRELHRAYMSVHHSKRKLAKSN